MNKKVVSYHRAREKIYFAELYLKQLEALVDQSRITAKAEQLAHWESAVFHLVQAYGFFLERIAKHSKIALPESRNAELLFSHLATQDYQGPEIGRIAQLMRDEQSWLRQLLAAYADIQQAFALGYAQDAEQLIAVDMEQARLLPLAKKIQILQFWISEIQALFQDLDDCLEEY